MICDVTFEERFWTRINKDGANGCWLWTGAKNDRGYGHLCLNRRFLYTHRIAYELLVRKLGPKEWCLHKCDTPLCANPDHLFIGDHAANMADKIAKGRVLWGEGCPRRKLSRAQAEQVLREYRHDPAHQWSNAKELAARYGVKTGAITSIVAGRSWPGLERNEESK